MRYSLLVPCYNARKYIDGFIDNINQLKQSFDEVLFYDDASTDDTVQLLLSKGLRVIEGETNKGPGYARNKLVENTICDWFHFHDIDDRLRPDYLTKVARLAERGEADVILCNVNWYDSQSEKLVLSWEYSDTLINDNAVVYTIAHPIGGINGLYRKSKFIETGGFNTGIRIWEDADLHVKLAGKNARFNVIEEDLSYSLRYPESASADQRTGWNIRAGLLQEYYETFKDQTIRAEIGKQAQVVASKFILLQQYAHAKKMLQLSELCKVKVPYNQSKLWGIIKMVTPSSFRIRLRIMQLKVAFNKTI